MIIGTLLWLPNDLLAIHKTTSNLVNIVQLGLACILPRSGLLKLQACILHVSARDVQD